MHKICLTIYIGFIIIPMFRRSELSQSKIIYFVIIAIFLTQSAYSIYQTCVNNGNCPTNSFCQNNSYCVCNSGFIVSCQIEATQLTNNFIESQISENYTYFILTPSELNQYLKFQITICNSQSGFNQTLSLWGDSGYLSDLTTANMLQSVNYLTNDECFTVQTTYFQFGQQPNGQDQQLYIGLILNTVATFQVKIKASQSLAYNSGIFNLITTIIMAVGTVGVLAILIFSLIKRRRQRLARQRSEQAAVKNDTAHFDQHMPVITADKVQMIPQQVCSVCLSQILRSDQIRVTICQHIFHSQCIDSWCRKNINCPICRQDLTSQAMQRFATERNSQGMNQLQMVERSNQDHENSIVWSVNNQAQENIQNMQNQANIEPLNDNNNIRERML